MNVRRTNPSLVGLGVRGLGCGCGCAQQSLNGLGMDTYSDMSWNPVSQGTQTGYFGVNAGDMAVNNPGTTANALARTTPDGATPTGAAVQDAFSNSYGGAQPGVLPLYPNATANGLSFVRTPPLSAQCQLVSSLNNNPMLFIAGTFAAVWLLSKGHAKYKERKARKAA